MVSMESVLRIRFDLMKHPQEESDRGVNMKFSDAILAGSVLVPEIKHGDINACALGMAADAVGIPRTDQREGNMPRYNAIYKQWPWLLTAGENCPKCGVRHWESEVIFHVFDRHVMGDRSMTLEQLVDYVRTIEPAEEVPTPSPDSQPEEISTQVRA